MVIVITVAFLWAFIVPVLAIPSIIKVAHEQNLFDVPNTRTVHEKLIPRLGGLAIFAGFVSSYTIFAPIHSQSRLIQEILAAIIILFLIGLKDDIGGTSVFKKFFMQLLATGIVVFFGGLHITSFHGLFGIYDIGTWLFGNGISEGVAIGISYFFTCLVILGITNAMNLIDGLDGLAGSVTCLIASSFAYYFFQYSVEFLTMAICLLGSVLGFLKFNFKKATIFMGDTGSMICGFLVAVLAIQFIEYSQVKNSPNISIAIIFIPIFDMMRVIIIRVLAGKSPFAPDKNHIHHVLLSLGIGQVWTVITLLLINLILILIVSGLSYMNPTILFLIMLAYSLLIVLILLLIKKKIIKSVA